MYSEGLRIIGKSGIGKAIEHQKTALTYEGIAYTTDRRDDYDILHINTWYPGSYLLARHAKRQGKKIVYHAHSTEEDYRNGFIFANQTSKLIKWWLIRCYRLGDVIITPTVYSKHLLESYRGLRQKKIYAVSNGVDPEQFRPIPEERSKFRNMHGFSDKDKVIIGIGLYIKRKGILDFVELARRLPEYHFIWFGYSPLITATAPVRKAVRTKPDNLTFAGYVEPDQIRAAMNGCDLFLFPTLEETEGIPVMEAMACHTPTLIRDIPVFADYLWDGVNIYKASSIDEFEDKITKILSGKLPDITGQYDPVTAKRDIHNIGKQLHEIYQNVL